MSKRTQIRILSILIQRGVDGRIADGNGTTVAFNGLRFLTSLDCSSNDNRRERDPDSEGGRQDASHDGQVVGLMALECWTGR